MTAIARVVSSASGTPVDVETLRTVFLFCGAGLMMSLLAASLGLDLSAGFFRPNGGCTHARGAAPIPMAVLAWSATLRTSR
jgi:hypothetical protein